MLKIKNSLVLLVLSALLISPLLSQDWNYNPLNVQLTSTSTADADKLQVYFTDQAVFQMAWIGDIPAAEPGQLTFTDVLQVGDSTRLVQQRLTDNLWKLSTLLEGAPKDNYTAIIAPTINDDSTLGYAAGSLWFDTVGLQVYSCLDASVGAAVWYKSSSDQFTNTDSSVKFIDIELGTGVNRPLLKDGAGDYSIRGGDTSASTAAGDYSVSFGGQTNISAAAHSVVLGGNGNRVGSAGQYSLVAGGNANNVNGATHSGIFGGNSNLVNTSATYSVISGGSNNVTSGLYCSISGGLGNNVSGAYSSSSGGWRNMLTGDFGGSLPGSLDSKSWNYGEVVKASGFFVTQGDAQISKAVLRILTPNATPLEMFLDGSAERYTVQADHVYGGTVKILATSSASDAKHAFYRRKFQIWNNAGTTALLGTVDTLGTDYESDAALNVAITADDTNDSINITVTGIAAINIRWVAWLELDVLKMP